VLFEAFFNKLAEDQLLTALVWGIAALQNADDPRTRASSRAVHQGKTKINRGLRLALVGALELLSAADWNSLFSVLYTGLGHWGVGTS
jgi:hypothetical protein